MTLKLKWLTPTWQLLISYFYFETKITRCVTVTFTLQVFRAF